MKYTLVTFVAILLISFPGHSILQTGQEGANLGTPLRVTSLRPKPCPTCYQGRVSFTNDSAIGDSLRVVIRDAEAWRKVWERIHYSPVQPFPPLPEFDFSREMVIVAALGGRPTGGYGIIVDPYERGGRLEVIVIKQTPGKACITTQMTTAPVDIVRLSKTERSVVFRETEIVHECK